MGGRGSITAISISARRGEKKRNVESAKLLEDVGIENDAHAQGGDRQVSMLMDESISWVRENGLDVSYGDFAENIVTRGVDLKSIRIGDRVRIGNTLLQVTVIGKECPAPCSIYYRMGSCIMPEEGVFCRVVEPGCIAVGDDVEIEPISQQVRG